jgi:K+-sensing histidine kinase KdpD
MRRVVELARLLSSEALSQSRLADHSGVILDLDSLEVFSVNETGMCLIEGLREGIEDYQNLVRRVVEEFDVDEAVARADVARFVDELARYLVDRRA